MQKPRNGYVMASKKPKQDVLVSKPDIIDMVIKGIIKNQNINDQYTVTHQERVMDLSMQIAKELKISDADVRLIGQAALVHDIGKANLPYQIIGKPGKLSPDETQYMQTHASLSYNILAGFEIIPNEMLLAVKQHHLGFDKKGYPECQNEETSFYALIIQVADVFEAMSMVRPYREKTPGRAEAIREINLKRGKAFHPDVVSAFNDLLGKGYHFNEPDLFNNVDYLEDIINGILLQHRLVDNYTGEHQNRVSVFAEKMATLIGLEGKDIAITKLAAKIHDIGKTAIPQELLMKRSFPTVEEREIIDSHTIKGYQILEGYRRIPQEIKDAVLLHHEYVRYRKSSFIEDKKPLTIHTKIIAIADFYDALSSDRPYRRATSREETFNIMLRPGIADDERADSAEYQLLVKTCFIATDQMN